MQIIVLLIPVLLVAFWLWMFNDMLRIENIPNTQAPRFSWPPEAKNHWFLCFIIFNIFTAGYYYFTKYNKD